nr:glutathione S-transferase [Saccharina japonica]
MSATTLSVFAGALAVLLSTASGFASTAPGRSAMTMAASEGGKPAFTLYSSDRCPYAQRTWIAARELGVPFEFHAMELGKDNREEWFLKLNPLGKVPTIVCGDDVVYESLVVNEYLADAFPPGGELGASPLLPASPAGRAMARVIAQRSNDLVTAYFTYLSNNDEEQEEGKREKFVKELKALDGWAADAAGEGEECGWLCGAAGEGCMTLADISYFPFLERIDATLKPFKGWSLSEIEAPALVAWMEKCRAKDSVAATLKDPALWAELYKKFLGADYFVRAGVAKK